MSIIGVLQDCYKNNCKSEICTGIQISTSEDSGWIVSIDLFDTAYETKSFAEVCRQRDNTDWFMCCKENQIFKGSGGIQNLEDILNVFYNWITSEES